MREEVVALFQPKEELLGSPQFARRARCRGSQTHGLEKKSEPLKLIRPAEHVGSISSSAKLYLLQVDTQPRTSGMLSLNTDSTNLSKRRTARRNDHHRG